MDDGAVTDDYYDNITSLTKSSIPGNLGSVDGTDQFIVWIQLVVDADDDEQLYLGVQDDGEFEIVSAITCLDASFTEVSGCLYSTDEQTAYLKVDLKNLCDDVSDACDDFDTSTPDSNEETLEFFIAFAAKDISGDLADAAESDDGVFYNLNISDKIPGGNLIINNAIPGDNKVTLDVAVESTLTQMGSELYQTIIEYDDGNTTEEFAEEPPITSGLIDLKDLTNGVTYSIRVAPMNKYQIRSIYSTKVSAKPQDIETFLKSQACYLVSAGFQKEHYVLDYFRHIRDAYLLKTEIGKRIVKFYYSTAPKYARVIYQDKTLSFIVIVLSYFLYYAMHSLIFLLPLLVIFTFFRLKANFR